MIVEIALVSSPPWNVIVPTAMVSSPRAAWNDGSPPGTMVGFFSRVQKPYIALTRQWHVTGLDVKNMPNVNIKLKKRKGRTSPKAIKRIVIKRHEAKVKNRAK